jgi:hypothetical protein
MTLVFHSECYISGQQMSQLKITVCWYANGVWTWRQSSIQFEHHLQNKDIVGSFSSLWVEQLRVVWLCLTVKTSHSGLMSSVNSGYEMLSYIKSFKRALGQVKLDSENEPKRVTEKPCQQYLSPWIGWGFCTVTK